MSSVEAGGGDEESAAPQTFREAEVLGLRQMQEGNYEGALKSESIMDSQVLPHVGVHWYLHSH